MLVTRPIVNVVMSRGRIRVNAGCSIIRSTIQLPPVVPWHRTLSHLSPCINGESRARPIQSCSSVLPRESAPSTWAVLCPQFGRTVGCPPPSHLRPRQCHPAVARWCIGQSRSV
eukprot:9487129-Pyramimonas_sp.AAC.1